MTTRVLMVAAACVLCGVLPSRAGSTDGFRYYADIERGAGTEQEILAVPLDSEVYSATHDHCADLRIVDAAGHEIPYQLSKVVATKETKTLALCPGRVVSLKEREGGGLDIAAALDKDAPAATVVRVLTPLKDFERRVQVSGSRDGESWHVLSDDGVLFDYSRFMDIRNHDIVLPENDDRQYRLTIEIATDEQASPLKELTRQFRGGTETEHSERTTLRERPLRIEGIEFYQSVSRFDAAQDAKRSYKLLDFRATEDEKRKETVIHVRTRNEPLTQFTIVSATPNFVRRATVLVPEKRANETAWREVGSATLSSIHFRNVERDALAITCPEQWADEYRIVIRNEDSPPLTITGVVAEGNVYQATFIAEPDAKYRLYFGSAQAKPPRYDTAALMADLGRRYASQTAALGPIVENGEFRATPAWRPLDSGLFFGAAIVVMVAVLGFVLYRALRKIDSLPSGE